MKKLFRVANRYIKESDWKIIALLKICLLSMGIALGMQIKDEYKKPVLIGCGAAFLATYVPLIAKLVTLFGKKEEKDPDLYI